MTAATMHDQSLAQRAGHLLSHAQRKVPVLQLAALAAICLYAYTTIPGISSRLSIYSVLILASFLGLAALGQTVVVLMGGIDFSVPGFILLGAFGICQLSGGSGWPPVLAIAALLLAGAVAGALGGAVSFFFNVQPLVVTLGIGTVLTGLMLAWVDGKQPPPAPSALGRISSPTGTTWGVSVPPVLVVWLLIAVVVAVVLRSTVLGRHVYLFGSNRRAADLTLVPVSRMWIGAFGLSAMSAVLVGVLLAGFSGTADVTLGEPYLFQSLTAVIVGGTAFGARGGYVQTVVGSLFLVMLSTVLLSQGRTYADQQIVYGVLILLAVGAYGRERRLRDRI